ncbi:MAG: secondary thiamine-phosphate synthase [Deltaproteobacteria bacterium HGW-Deltaproteobacteria-14]|jgi:secondary thiamine-phosphate synthase enzyme|nr:MAG: secondary thiamine-phosphate synthase [Deltaproteobacteria bacterium HGW-Deltaproteobacteria-14]
MATHQQTLELRTRGQGTYEITERVAAVVAAAGVDVGLCNVFVHHTSASLIITENADPDVQRDLDAFLARLVPEGDRLYVHTAEGPDDMPAHVKCALTATALTIPVTRGRLALGTWQGIFLWEHRRAAHHRTVTVTVG